MIIETYRRIRLKPFETNKDGNLTFVIGDPMNKVLMGKNKSFVSSDNTQVFLVHIIVFGSYNCYTNYTVC